MTRTHVHGIRHAARRARAVAAIALLGTTVTALLLAALPAPATTGPHPLVLTAAANPHADLYPGSVGAAQFTVNNPNPFPVRLESLAFGPVRSSAPADCPPHLLSTHELRLAGEHVVPAGATNAHHSIPGAFTLARAAPNGCQTITFTISATVHAVALGAEHTTPSPTLAETGTGIATLAATSLTLILTGTLIWLAVARRRHGRSAKRCPFIRQ